MATTLDPATLDEAADTARPAAAADTLAASIAALLLLAVVQRVVGFVRAILFCRWLNPAELGQWDVAFGFLMLAAPLSVLALSGAFGRYVEHFRRRGHLRRLIARTALFCGLASGIVAATLAAGADGLAACVFGSQEQLSLATLLALALPPIVAFNYVTDLLTGLRRARLVAGLQLLNGLGFAAFSIALLWLRPHRVEGIVLGYAGACVLTCLAAAPTLWQVWHDDRPAARGPADFWSKLLPFAAWVWIAAFLSSLFEVADRYMIVHCSGLPPKDAWAMVGQYHSSRLLPLLLVSIASMLAGVVTPYLSHDWEHGRRRRVVRRLNLFVKLLGGGLATAGVTVLAVAPLLFHTAFGGKYAAGLTLLPWTVLYCTWFGSAVLLQNYLWCCEHARWSSGALVAGLGVGVGLNWLLLPSMGLAGVALAATAANLVVLLAVCGFNRRLGFRLDGGALAVLVVPAALPLGLIPAALAVAGLTVAAAATHRIFTRREKAEMLGRAARYLDRLRRAR